MRHLMTSFLALHWAAVFALLGYLCISDGIDAVLAALGADSAHRLVAGGLSPAPVAVAFLLVSALFCWACIESCLGAPDPDTADNTAKIAFVAAGAVFSLVLLDGIANGMTGLSGVGFYLVGLMICYLAVLGERWTALVSSGVRRDDARLEMRAMARGAADTSLLGRISGRPDLGKRR